MSAQRWWRFNAVGVLGFVVQLGVLGLCAHALHWDYLLATALAVEAALLHNFFWHERYTWADRTARAPGVRSAVEKAVPVGQASHKEVPRPAEKAWYARHKEAFHAIDAKHPGVASSQSPLASSRAKKRSSHPSWKTRRWVPGHTPNFSPSSAMVTRRSPPGWRSWRPRRKETASSGSA